MLLCLGHHARSSDLYCWGMKFVWSLSGRLEMEICPTEPRRFIVSSNMQKGARRKPELAWSGQLIARRPRVLKSGGRFASVLLEVPSEQTWVGRLPVAPPAFPRGPGITLVPPLDTRTVAGCCKSRKHSAEDLTTLLTLLSSSGANRDLSSFCPEFILGHFSPSTKRQSSGGTADVTAIRESLDNSFPQVAWEFEGGSQFGWGSAISEDCHQDKGSPRREGVPPVCGPFSCRVLRPGM